MSDRLDRYARRELSPSEARALAQESLDSPALFDELTDTALAQSALDARTARTGRVVGMPRKTKFLMAGLVAAAAVIGVSLLSLRSNPVRALKPVLEMSANAEQPVLLASGLHPSGAPVFRGAEPDSRVPQPVGSIVSVEDGSVSIDLGSLDGLAKGSELPIFRGNSPVGRLLVTTVFRDRARGRISEGGTSIGAKDEVRVAPVDHLGALLEQVDARFNSGDAEAAGKLAQEAVRWGEAAGVPPRALAIGWNELAALRLMRSDTDGVEGLLARVISSSPKTDLVYAEATNNLGVLAELRGDRHKAEAIYRDALHAFAGEERRTAERNLARLRETR